jgi:hypothetical protein
MAVIVVDDADLETESGGVDHECDGPEVKLSKMWCVRVARSTRYVPIKPQPVIVDGEPYFVLNTSATWLNQVVTGKSDRHALRYTRLKELVSQRISEARVQADDSPDVFGTSSGTGVKKRKCSGSWSTTVQVPMPTRADDETDDSVWITAISNMKPLRIKADQETLEWLCGFVWGESRKKKQKCNHGGAVAPTTQGVRFDYKTNTYIVKGPGGQKSFPCSQVDKAGMPVPNYDKHLNDVYMLAVAELHSQQAQKGGGTSGQPPDAITVACDAQSSTDSQGSVADNDFYEM